MPDSRCITTPVSVLLDWRVSSASNYRSINLLLSSAKWGSNATQDCRRRRLFCAMRASGAQTKTKARGAADCHTTQLVDNTMRIQLEQQWTRYHNLIFVYIFSTCPPVQSSLVLVIVQYPPPREQNQKSKVIFRRSPQQRWQPQQQLAIHRCF